MVETVPAQGPHSYILMTGDQSDIFGSEILAKSDFFRSMKDAGTFFGSQKKAGILGGCKKRTKGFFGYARKVVIFSEVVISPPPPPPTLPEQRGSNLPQN